MVFAVITAKTAVFSRRMKLDGGVALLHLCICNTPMEYERHFIEEKHLVLCLAFGWNVISKKFETCSLQGIGDCYMNKSSVQSMA